MAKGKRRSTSIGERWLYFYLNGKLHRTISVNRSENLLVAWDYEAGKRVAYVLTDAYQRRQRAYTAVQVGRLLNRHYDTIVRHLMDGNIQYPQHAYSLSGKRKITRYLFSEDDIRKIHEFFKTVHQGRPRKDGQINTGDLISTPELEALLRNETVLYTKTDGGEFVPVFKQPEW
jgi:hypothetical protein